MTVKEYANLVPSEIKKAIKSLSNEKRIAVVAALIKNGESSFSELQKDLEIERTLLAAHLKILAKSSLVEHYYKHEEGNQKYSFYSTTGFGKDLINVLVSSLVPPQPFVAKDAIEGPGITGSLDVSFVGTKSTSVDSQFIKTPSLIA